MRSCRFSFMAYSATFNRPAERTFRRSSKSIGAGRARRRGDFLRRRHRENGAPHPREVLLRLDVRQLSGAVTAFDPAGGHRGALRQRECKTERAELTLVAGVYPIG